MTQQAQPGQPGKPQRSAARRRLTAWPRVRGRGITPCSGQGSRSLRDPARPPDRAGHPPDDQPTASPSASLLAKSSAADPRGARSCAAARPIVSSSSVGVTAFGADSGGVRSEASRDLRPTDSRPAMVQPGYGLWRMRTLRRGSRLEQRGQRTSQRRAQPREDQKSAEHPRWPRPGSRRIQVLPESRSRFSDASHQPRPRGGIFNRP
jgi:hypothetical protein